MIIKKLSTLSKLGKLNKLRKASLLLPLWSFFALLISCGEQIPGAASQDQNNEIIAYRFCTQANNITSAINSTPLAAAAVGGVQPDPFEQYQWYLDKAGVRNVAGGIGAWTRFTTRPGGAITPGENVNISVIDDAVQITHEDLRSNSLDRAGLASASINLHVGTNGRSPLRFNPSPNQNCDPHGTAVAGIIAAEGDNGIGIKGISYGAGLWGANLLLTGGVGIMDVVRVLRHRLENTAVSSNSWSPTGLGLNDADDRILMAMDDGIEMGWGGLGTNFVFSAGNDRVVALTAVPGEPSTGGRSDYDEIKSHRAAIVVCAVGEDDILSTYSEHGANLWLCGYSNVGNDEARMELPNAITLTGTIDQTSVDMDAANAISPSAADSRWARRSGLPTTDLLGNVGYNQRNNTIVRLQPASGGGMACNFFPNTSPPFNFDSPQLIVEPGCISAPPPANAINSDIPWDVSPTTVPGLNPVPVNSNNASYHRYFTGTSASAPVVSGVIGLIRSYNTTLTWRDVKVILAESASVPITPAIDPTTMMPVIDLTTMMPVLVPVTSQSMGARYTDPATTYFHDDNHGFGIVNASRAVELADSWTALPDEKSWQSVIRNAQGTAATGDVINYPADTDMALGNDADITFIEHVEVEIMARITNPIQLERLQMSLQSPAGRTITLVQTHTCANMRVQPVDTEACPPIFQSNFNFGVAALLGENPTTSTGNEWILRATSDGNPIDSFQYRIRIYGH